MRRLRSPLGPRPALRQGAPAGLFLFLVLGLGVLVASCSDDPTELSEQDGAAEAAAETREDSADPTDADQYALGEAETDSAEQAAPETPEPASEDAEEVKTPPAEESEDVATEDEAEAEGPEDSDTDLAEEDTAEEKEEEGPDPRLELLIELTDVIDRDVVERIGAAVAERRGLPLLEPVPVYLLRREDLPAFLDSDDEDDGPSFDERLFPLLGIIEPEVSLDDLFRNLFVGLALGFYDFDLQGFVIISANDHISGGDISTITHEFVHVLQDQNFDITGYFDEHDDNADRILAARFVVEGDARLSEGLFRDLESEFAATLEARRDRLPGLNGSIPALLQIIFNAPYRTGVEAIGRILQAEGYAGVDALLTALPPSTEQLLHPEKLAEDERPIEIDAPDVAKSLGDGWESLGADTMGEFILGTLLSPIVGVGRASQAAAGWGGDRLTLYRLERADGAHLVAWELHWDSEKDAGEFVDAADEWLAARTGAAVETLAEGMELHSRGSELSAWMRRSGDVIFIAIGDDAEAVERVRLIAIP